MEHAGIPGHIYPLAILCHDIMPPPPKVTFYFAFDILLLMISSDLKFLFAGGKRNWGEKNDIIPWGWIVSGTRNRFPCRFLGRP